MESIRRILRTGGNSGQEESRPQSARAEALLQEFESSEKGWFWETDREGNLSYVSESVARALGREAHHRRVHRVIEPRVHQLDPESAHDER